MTRPEGGAAYRSGDRPDPPTGLPAVAFHLDLIGGLAGDMFVAAMLDLRPDLEAGLRDFFARCALLNHVSFEVAPCGDGVLAGRRFLVERQASDEHDRNDHADWRDIRARIEAADLDPPVKGHALRIFELLARAEAKVHGVAEDEVTFHEVGAWDSIADVLAAAWLIAAVGPVRWTAGDIPLGSGRIHTAHGFLPVPAPATAILLEGFPTIEDGIGGERVTPTGAAILAYLCWPASRISGRRQLGRSGFGFGTRELPGISNCVRILAFTEAAPAGMTADTVATIAFEIDDQSAEDLAIGLDRIRAHSGVLDLIQWAALGKKGRMVTAVRLLTRPDALDAVVALCFEETTTIGLRHGLQDRVLLRRSTEKREVDGTRVRVKTVARPSGTTAKAEADDLAAIPSHGRRAATRRAAERDPDDDSR